jgi:predicted DNA-binding transcriptional regulator AlpA
MNAAPQFGGTELVSEERFAKDLNKHIATVRRWRREGKGPKFLRLGNSVYHRSSDIETWLCSCEVSTA